MSAVAVYPGSKIRMNVDFPHTWPAVAICAAFALVGVLSLWIKAMIGVGEKNRKARAEQVRAEAVERERLADIASSQSDRSIAALENLNAMYNQLRGEFKAMQRELDIQRTNNYQMRQWIQVVTVIDAERRKRVKQYCAVSNRSEEEVELMLGPELPAVPGPNLMVLEAPKE